MKNNYKIVCNTAAGRRRYMQYLVPQVVCCDIVDRYDIWVNTMDARDLEFFRMLAKQYPKIRLVWQPDGIIDGNNSINAFYKDCCDEDTIYIKLDDDIVWIESGYFEKIVQFRIDNPQYFLISPLVINNQKSTYILQCKDLLPLEKYRRADPFDKILLKSGKFAKELHQWFISNYLTKEQYQNLHCGTYPMGITRFSINSIVWFGRQMKSFGGIVEGDDEEFLSSIKPTLLRQSNCLYGDAIIAHFAFGPQRKQLDATNLLQQYGDYLHEKWKQDPQLKEIDTYVQSCLKTVNEYTEEDIKNLSFPPYKCPIKENKLKRRLIFLWGRILYGKKPYIKSL